MQPVSKMKKAELLDYIAKLEQDNISLRNKLYSIENNLSNSNTVTQLKSEVEDLQERNNELEQQVEKLEFSLEDKLIIFADPLQELFDSLSNVVQPYSTLDNKIFFAKSSVNDYLVDTGLPNQLLLK